MNGSPLSTSRAPLRVYLAGSADPQWRTSLLRAEAHEAYAIAVQGGSSETVLHGALPYNHTMVGPFTVRTHLEPYDLQPTDVYTFTRTRHLANAERYRMRSLARADIIFCWIPHAWDQREELPLDFASELGLAYGTGKAVVVATSSKEVLEHSPFLTEFAFRMVVDRNARDAYERIMADLDVTFERGMARIESKYGGQCRYCRSAYKEGETIFWSKVRGGMHVDCFARLQHDEQEPNAVVFNSELVHALREENAKLERESLDLMVKNSALEQEKARLLEEKTGAEQEAEGWYQKYLEAEGR